MGCGSSKSLEADHSSPMEIGAEETEPSLKSRASFSNKPALMARSRSVRSVLDAVGIDFSGKVTRPDSVARAAEEEKVASFAESIADELFGANESTLIAKDSQFMELSRTLSLVRSDEDGDMVDENDGVSSSSSVCSVLTESEHPIETDTKPLSPIGPLLRSICEGAGARVCQSWQLWWMHGFCRQLVKDCINDAINLVEFLSPLTTDPPNATGYFQSNLCLLDGVNASLRYHTVEEVTACGSLDPLDIRTILDHYRPLSGVLFHHDPLDEIVSVCEAFGALFVDPYFPAKIIPSVLKEYEVHSQQAVASWASLKDGDLSWRRPSSLVMCRMHSEESRREVPPVLFGRDPRRSFMQQCVLGDGWFLSALSAVAMHYDIRDLIRPNTALSPWGAYSVRLFVNGTWNYVVVDDLFPCLVKKFQGVPAFSWSCDVSGTPEIWVMIIEKAIAKLCGRYITLSKDHSDGMMVTQWLTGCASLDWIGPESDSMASLRQHLTAGAIATATCVGGSTLINDKVKEKGLLPHHSYLIIGSVDVDGNILLRMRNPWNRKEWKGSWSDNDKKWKQVDSETQRKLNSNIDKDGLFWMPAGAFEKYFMRWCTLVYPMALNWNSIEVCENLIVPQLDAKIVSMFPRWPQYEIVSSQPTTLIINLTRVDVRYKVRHAAFDIDCSENVERRSGSYDSDDDDSSSERLSSDDDWDSYSSSLVQHIHWDERVILPDAMDPIDDGISFVLWIMKADNDNEINQKLIPIHWQRDKEIAQKGLLPSSRPLTIRTSIPAGRFVVVMACSEVAMEPGSSDKISRTNPPNASKTESGEETSEKHIPVLLRILSHKRVVTQKIYSVKMRHNVVSKMSTDFRNFVGGKVLSDGIDPSRSSGMGVNPQPKMSTHPIVDPTAVMSTLNLSSVIVDTSSNGPISQRSERSLVSPPLSCRSAQNSPKRSKRTLFVGSGVKDTIRDPLNLSASRNVNSSHKLVYSHPSAHNENIVPKVEIPQSRTQTLPLRPEAMSWTSTASAPPLYDHSDYF